MKARLFGSALLGTMLGLCGPPPATLAQVPPAPAAPRPDRTTAAYGDWILRCEVPPSGTEQTCEVAQSVLDGRGAVLAHLTVRRGAAPAQVVLSAQVGASATVSEPLRLGIGERPVLTLPFQRCLPRGCFAEGPPSEVELGALMQGGEGAKVEFRDGAGQATSIPVSLRGLRLSLDALRTAERGR